MADGRRTDGRDILSLTPLHVVVAAENLDHSRASNWKFAECLPPTPELDFARFHLSLASQNCVGQR